jgi:hypothetical protein
MMITRGGKDQYDDGGRDVLGRGGGKGGAKGRKRKRKTGVSSE